MLPSSKRNKNIVNGLLGAKLSYITDKEVGIFSQPTARLSANLQSIPPWRFQALLDSDAAIQPLNKHLNTIETLQQPSWWFKKGEEHENIFVTIQRNHKVYINIQFYWPKTRSFAKILDTWSVQSFMNIDVLLKTTGNNIKSLSIGYVIRVANNRSFQTDCAMDQAVSLGGVHTVGFNPVEDLATQVILWCPCSP